MEVREMDAKTAHEWLQQGRAELIDIRDDSERAELWIPQSRWMPLTGLRAGLKGQPEKTVGIFHCRSGRRTHANRDMLAAVGHDEAYVMDGGIQAWQQAGCPTESKSTVIPVMRQVQIASGGLIVLGVLLGALMEPWFYALAGFVGAGLVYAGVSGSCGMAMMLSRLPFNR